jgi:hypothetical protein
MLVSCLHQDDPEIMTNAVKRLQSTLCAATAVELPQVDVLRTSQQWPLGQSLKAALSGGLVQWSIKLNSVAGLALLRSSFVGAMCTYVTAWVNWLSLKPAALTGEIHLVLHLSCWRIPMRLDPSEDVV